MGNDSDPFGICRLVVVVGVVGCCGSFGLGILVFLADEEIREDVFGGFVFVVVGRVFVD